MPSVPCAQALPLGHLHLAAQIPHTWLTTPKAGAVNSHIVRKVAFRAVLNHIMGLSNLPPPNTRQAEGTGITEMHLRLGKLPEEVYDDFTVFLLAASEKLGQDLISPFMETFGPISIPTGFVSPDLLEMICKMEVLHTIRCLLGPLVETLIIKDRLEWLDESLPASANLEVKLMTLFDQNLGSGRNIAIILQPQDRSESSVCV